MMSNLNYVSDFTAGLWITAIVCTISVIFPTLLYWVLLMDKRPTRDRRIDTPSVDVTPMPASSLG